MKHLILKQKKISSKELERLNKIKPVKAVIFKFNSIVVVF